MRGIYVLRGYADGLRCFGLLSIAWLLPIEGRNYEGFILGARASFHDHRRHRCPQHPCCAEGGVNRQADGPNTLATTRLFMIGVSHLFLLARCVEDGPVGEI